MLGRPLNVSSLLVLDFELDILVPLLSKSSSLVSFRSKDSDFIKLSNCFKLNPSASNPIIVLFNFSPEKMGLARTTRGLPVEAAVITLLKYGRFDSNAPIIGSLYP